MAGKVKQASWPVVTFLIIAVILWLRDELPTSPDQTTAGAASIEDARYERIEGCKWVDHRQNDGDSFRVRLPNGQVKQIRLYFVDAPESAFKTYGGGRNNHQRIAEQARELKVTSQQAVEIGVEAKNWVHSALRSASMTIFTEWDDPFGDERYHAFIVMPDGGWLHERLVNRGFVRIHTKGADLPGGRDRHTQERHLEGLEAKARKAGKGVWGL